MISELIRDALHPRPTDVAINFEGQKIWEALPSKDLTEKDILFLQNEHSYNAATWVLYKYFKQLTPTEKLQQFIDSPHHNYAAAHRNYRVVVIAHDPWKSRYQNELYQERLKNLALDMGFDVATMEGNYRRNLFANAYSYQEKIKKWNLTENPKKILFLTYGVGSLELKWMFQKTQMPLDFVVGWLNLSGLIHGTALPPSSTNWQSRWLSFLSRYPVSAEILRSSIYCKQPLHFERTLVSVVSMNPDTAFSTEQHARHQDLKFWGPHDGCSSLVDYMNPTSGIVYPIWGETHEMDVEVYKNRLQSILKYILLNHNEFKNEFEESHRIDTGIL